MRRDDRIRAVLNDVLNVLVLVTKRAPECIFVKLDHGCEAYGSTWSQSTLVNDIGAAGGSPQESELSAHNPRLQSLPRQLCVVDNNVMLFHLWQRRARAPIVHQWPQAVMKAVIWIQQAQGANPWRLDAIGVKDDSRRVTADVAETIVSRDGSRREDAGMDAGIRVTKEAHDVLRESPSGRCERSERARMKHTRLVKQNNERYDESGRQHVAHPWHGESHARRSGLRRRGDGAQCGMELGMSLR